jgi:hypothetical protein
LAQRCAASADLGILAICALLGQATGFGFIVGFFEGLSTGFLAGFACGLGLATTGTLMVFVIVCVEDDPGVLSEDPTQTVTEPEPMLDPWLSPEPEARPEHAIATPTSNPVIAVAKTMQVKLKDAICLFLMEET